MKTHIIPLSKCPFCGDKKLNRSTPVTNDEAPVPGDFTVCIKCGELLVFDLDLRLRKPTEDEKQRALGIPQITEHQILIAGGLSNWRQRQRILKLI